MSRLPCHTDSTDNVATPPAEASDARRGSACPSQSEVRAARLLSPLAAPLAWAHTAARHVEPHPRAGPDRRRTGAEAHVRVAGKGGAAARLLLAPGCARSGRRSLLMGRHSAVAPTHGRPASPVTVRERRSEPEGCWGVAAWLAAWLACSARDCTRGTAPHGSLSPLCCALRGSGRVYLWALVQSRSGLFASAHPFASVSATLSLRHHSNRSRADAGARTCVNRCNRLALARSPSHTPARVCSLLSLPAVSGRSLAPTHASGHF